MDSTAIALASFVNTDLVEEYGLEEYPFTALEVGTAVSTQYGDASGQEEEEVAEQTRSDGDSESECDRYESTEVRVKTCASMSMV